MREVGAFEAKNKFGKLLDWVERGEEVMITCHGKEVARLVPAKPGFNRAEAHAAVRRIRERADQLKTRPLRLVGMEGISRRRPPLRLTDT